MRIFTKLSKVSKVNFNINKFLEERFQRFFSSYSLAYNKQQGRTGSLFQKRFKRIHIDSDKYIIKLVHYIHNNPIHHHFCKSYSAWKFSSYYALTSKNSTKLEKQSLLNWFGEVNDFIEFHEQMIDYSGIDKYLIEENI